MANLRFIMKMADKKLAWSERHFVSGFSPNPITTIPSAVLAFANPLMQARAALFGAGVKMLGGVFTFDDAQRDGYPIQYVPSAIPQSAIQPTDPDLCILMSASSQPTLPLNPSYQSQFYLSGVPSGNIGDQQLNILKIFQPLLDAYILQLTTVAGGYGWGWKAVNKLSLSVPVLSVTAGVAPAQPAGSVVLTFAAPSPATVGQIVNLKQMSQTIGKTLKLNGRWIVNNVVGNTVVLVRKKTMNTANVNYGGGGRMIIQTSIVVPYTAIIPTAVAKHNRGGTLGLQLGRSKTRTSTV